HQLQHLDDLSLGRPVAARICDMYARPLGILCRARSERGHAQKLVRRAVDRAGTRRIQIVAERRGPRRAVLDEPTPLGADSAPMVEESLLEGGRIDHNLSNSDI